MNSTTNAICFKDMLSMAGATVVSTIPEGEFFNLSPEKLTKETFIDLISPLPHK
ncbi:MAG: hypothetical protein Q9M28_04305 [Mariprofundaceae bacterium]|nr:hypothetical protein [Mariprofundaceae bacterium]